MPLAPGVNMSSIGFFVGLDPTRFGGRHRAQRVGQLVRMDGGSCVAFPSRGDAVGVQPRGGRAAFPPHFYGRSTRTTTAVGGRRPLPRRCQSSGRSKLARAYFVYEYPGYVAFGGGDRRESSSSSASSAGIDGEFNASNGRFSLVGHIEACLADVICGRRHRGGLERRRGRLRHCGPINVGGGVQWARGSDKPFICGRSTAASGRASSTPNVRGNG